MIDWMYIHDNFDWLGHILEALVMAGVYALLARIFVETRVAILVGLAFAIGHFHGREKRDFEVSVQMPPPHLDGYYFWNWNWDQTTDFWPVAFVLVALALIVDRRLR